MSLVELQHDLKCPICTKKVELTQHWNQPITTSVICTNCVYQEEFEEFADCLTQDLLNKTYQQKYNPKGRHKLRSST